jgi:hypothetical protein
VSLLPPDRELCCPAEGMSDERKTGCIGAIAGEVIEIPGELEAQILYACPVFINRRRALRGERALTDADFAQYSEAQTVVLNHESEFMLSSIEDFLTENEE